ncbi:MAG: hypothetical protein WD048_06190, partial [Chitinophagales bacterium]
IVGGVNNNITADYGFIGGGDNNAVTASGGAAFGVSNRVSGFNAVSFGSQNTVLGEGGAAFGRNNRSSGISSTVFGEENQALNGNAIAGGYQSYTNGGSSIAIGWADSITDFAVGAAIVGGVNNNITADYGFIGGGESNSVSATGGAAFGASDTASGYLSFAANRNNRASGNHSAVFGQYNRAPSLNEFVVGMYATKYTPTSPSISNANDRLFVVGNGIDESNRSNAITVLKSGNTGIGHETPVSSLDVDGTLGVKVKTGLAAGTDNPDEEAVVYIYSGGTGSIALPTASSVTNRVYTIVNSTGGVRTITSYVNLNGASVSNIGNGTSIEIISDGTNWYQIR